SLTGTDSITDINYNSHALKSDSTVSAWDENDEGELGNGSFTTNPPYGSATPAHVSGLTNIVAIAGGAFHGLALPRWDSTPPTTTAGLSPSPNAAGWNNSDVTVALSATDDAGGTGVQRLNYYATGAQTIASAGAPIAVSSGADGTATATIKITAEGATTFSFFATDNAGNVEATKSVTVKLDKTPPAITETDVVAEATGPDGASVTFSPSVSDALSG